MPKDAAPIVVDTDPETYEDKHVHAIYDEIANHFSSTRYKPWPIIARFLSDLPAGWIGLDAGTGNGKYLPLPLGQSGKIWNIGLDRSMGLLKIARHAGGATREVVLGNVLQDCWRAGCFDYAVSIATIHHLATPERRMTAVQRLLQAVSPDHGKILLYVWAIEQDELSHRRFPSSGGDLSTGQDVLVPWVCSEYDGDTPEAQSTVPRIYNRYYHMFAKGELSDLVRRAAQRLGLDLAPALTGQTGKRGIEIVREGWERSNYYVELRLWRVP